MKQNLSYESRDKSRDNYGSKIMELCPFCDDLMRIDLSSEQEIKKVCTLRENNSSPKNLFVNRSDCVCSSEASSDN